MFNLASYFPSRDSMSSMAFTSVKAIKFKQFDPLISFKAQYSASVAMLEDYIVLAQFLICV